MLPLCENAEMMGAATGADKWQRRGKVENNLDELGTLVSRCIGLKPIG